MRVRALRGAEGGGVQQSAKQRVNTPPRSRAPSLAAPPDFDTAASLQRMVSVSALQRSQLASAARGEAGGEAPGARSARAQGGGELLRVPSMQPADSEKTKRAPASDGPSPEGSGGGDERAGAGGGGPAGPSVSTREGRAALAALAREAHSRGADALWRGCGDPVAALVGAGYLLLRAGGFRARAAAAVGGLAGGLRRMASLAPGGGALAEADALRALRSFSQQAAGGGSAFAAP